MAHHRMVIFAFASVIPTIESLNLEPVIWQEIPYQVEFEVVITHQVG